MIEGSPHASSEAGDAAAIQAQLHFWTVRTALVRQVLHRARRGELQPDWRDTLSADHAHGVPVDQRFRDAEAMAAREVADLPPALWEPLGGSGWRRALDEWFLAMRQVLCDEADNTARVHQLMRRMPHHTVQGAMPDQLRHDLIGALDRSDPTYDDSVAAAHDQAIADRDHLGAWYRAGLTAGGETIDWVNWYLSRVARWRDRHRAHKTQTRLADPNYQRLMQHLPSYWE